MVIVMTTSPQINYSRTYVPVIVDDFVEIEEDVEELTKLNVMVACVVNCDSPEWVWRQAMLESGHLKSNITKTNNNIFGMDLPKLRNTLAIGCDSNGIAIYKNWEESIVDYAMWQQYKPRVDSLSYCDYLISRCYCPINSNYINILKNIKLKYN